MNESEKVPDPSDAAGREGLSASAIQAFVSIAHNWKLTEEQARGLLGGVASPTYHAWQADPSRAQLDQEAVTRISLVIGIFKALKICLEEPLADQWVTREHGGPLFGGHTVIDFMIERGQPGMVEVCRLVESWCAGQ
jgi:hypothetical protein